jgi:hypothetical protein
MYANTTGISNNAVGDNAMRFSTTGSYNVALGHAALYNNTTASNNTAVGYQAGYSNTTGAGNTLVGMTAGYSLTTGTLNTIVGPFLTATGGAGDAITTGSKNTILGGYNGNQSGLDIRTASNRIVLSDGDGNPRGVFTSSGTFLVGKGAAGDTVVGSQIGADGYITATRSESTNANTTYHVYSTGAGAYRFYVGMGGTVYATSTTISSLSDIRFKENVRDLDAGLTEIMALRPRLYDWKEGKGPDIKNARGFIAQEFETVFPDLIDTWKETPPEGEDPYKSVRADLIPVLVKAIQELKAEFDAYKATHL